MTINSDDCGKRSQKGGERRWKALHGSACWSRGCLTAARASCWQLDIYIQISWSVDISAEFIYRLGCCTVSDGNRLLTHRYNRSSGLPSFVITNGNNSFAIKTGPFALYNPAGLNRTDLTTLTLCQINETKRNSQPIVSQRFLAEKKVRERLSGQRLKNVGSISLQKNKIQWLFLSKADVRRVKIRNICLMFYWFHIDSNVAVLRI